MPLAEASPTTLTAPADTMPSFIPLCSSCVYATGPDRNMHTWKPQKSCYRDSRSLLKGLCCPQSHYQGSITVCHYSVMFQRSCCSTLPLPGTSHNPHTHAHFTPSRIYIRLTKWEQCGVAGRRGHGLPNTVTFI